MSVIKREMSVIKLYTTLWAHAVKEKGNDLQKFSLQRRWMLLRNLNCRESQHSLNTESIRVLKVRCYKRKEQKNPILKLFCGAGQLLL